MIKLGGVHSRLGKPKNSRQDRLVRNCDPSRTLSEQERQYATLGRGCQVISDLIARS